MDGKKQTTVYAIGKIASPLLSPFSGARNSPLANKIEQLHRYATGSRLSPSDRYWRWCAFIGETEIDRMLDFTYSNSDYFRRKNSCYNLLVTEKN